MRLIAVVLNWNGGEDTLAALASLSGVETICVDNGSTDGSDELVEQRFPGVELLRTHANLGYAGGNNAGLRRALERGADWVLILNNDAVADAGVPGALERAALERPDAGLLACKIVGEDGAVQFGGAPYRRWIGYSGRAGARSPDVPPGGLRDVDRADGAASAVSRAAAEAAGLLDESLFLYVEDVEWSLRIRRAGFAVVYVSGAVVRHKGSAASGGRSSTTNLYYDTRNTIVVLEKHARLPRGLTALRRGVVVGAHAAQTVTHPARRDALRAVFDGWRDARAGRLGQRSSP